MTNEQVGLTIVIVVISLYSLLWFWLGWACKGWLSKGREAATPQRIAVREEALPPRVPTRVVAQPQPPPDLMSLPPAVALVTAAQQMLGKLGAIQGTLGGIHELLRAHHSPASASAGAPSRDGVPPADRAEAMAGR